MGKIKYDNMLGNVNIDCPGCGQTIIFHQGAIRVNCETNQKIEVQDLLHLKCGCKNPFCKWSKIKGCGD